MPFVYDYMAVVLNTSWAALLAFSIYKKCVQTTYRTTPHSTDVDKNSSYFQLHYFNLNEKGKKANSMLGIDLFNQGILMSYSTKECFDVIKRPHRVKFGCQKSSIVTVLSLEYIYEFPRYHNVQSGNLLSCSIFVEEKNFDVNFERVTLDLIALPNEKLPTLM